MTPRLTNTIRSARRARGYSQEKLARLAGVSRQSYAAIEDGRATPSTAVALRLAHVLETTVEGLFRLEDQPGATVKAEWSGAPPGTPTRVQLWRVGGRVIARPLSGSARRGLPRADGLARAADGGRVTVQLLQDRPERPMVVMLGCDPSALLLSEVLGREREVDLLWSETGSHAALMGLARGDAHVAGCHLFDEATGTYNLPWVERLVPFSCTLVGFAVWEQGLLLRRDGPFTVRGVADLAQSGLRFVNREPGSGSRLLLDHSLETAGIPPGAVAGYDLELPGHLAVAEAVASGLADAGVGIRAAAVAYDLAFVPLGEEHYDMVVPQHFLDLGPVQALLDQLRRPTLRRQVEALGGYDVNPMGLPG